MEIPNNPGQAVTMTTGCSTQTDSKGSLLKTTSTQFIEHGEVEVVPTQNLHPLCAILLGTGRYSARYQKRNVHTNRATNHLSTMMSCLQDIPV